MALMLFELGLEALEQGEGVGRRPGEAGQDLVAEQLAHLAGRGLDDDVAEGHLAVAAEGELHAAWNLAVGEPLCHQTEVGDVRRGVLNVTVAHPALLEELSAFRKPALLSSLRQNLTGTVIHDIRFRVGPISGPQAASEPEPRPGPRAPGRPGGSKPST